MKVDFNNQKIANNVYQTVKTVGATPKKLYSNFKYAKKMLDSKMQNYDTYMQAKSFLRKNKDFVAGAGIIALGVVLAGKCIKEIADKLKEIREK